METRRLFSFSRRWYNSAMKRTSKQQVPVALTIAGSDSGGGAGIQADLRSFRAFGVHGCTAITALTAQNPHGVSGIQGATTAMLRGQLERIAEDFEVQAVKTGMLLNARLIRVVADFREAFGKAQWVVDPVMVATSGARLLKPDAVALLRRELLPRATLITPNLPEAEALLDCAPLSSQKAIQAAVQELHARLGTAVLLKGGHARKGAAVDIFCNAQGTCYRIATPEVKHPLTTHGTGCALSSAIAANLALGLPLLEAIVQAKAYLLTLLSAARPAGNAAVYGPEQTPPPRDLVQCDAL